MKIGILSDTHSRYQTVERALQLLQERKVNVVLHCGDIEDADTVWLFHGFTTHFVFGNCDSERTSLRQAIHGIGETLHEPFGRIELNDVTLGFTHGDDHRLLRDMENSGAFDYVFHGHTHQAADRLVGKTRVINPGALHRARPKTLIVLDLASGNIESIVVE
jgi:putative phosphoesterase